MNGRAWCMKMAGGGRCSMRRIFSARRIMRALVSVADKTACASLSAAIIAYQKAVSPLLGNRCRFHPACSHYALTALERHGLLKGLFLGARRLVRCNGLFPGGYDPVP